MKIKNIYGKRINVLNKPLEYNEVMEITTEESKTNEIRNLFKQKYIEEVQ